MGDPGNCLGPIRWRYRRSLFAAPNSTDYEQEHDHQGEPHASHRLTSPWPHGWS